MSNNYKHEVFGSINVPLAILWAKPFHDKVYKEISNKAANNSTAWADNLNIKERLWLVGKVDTTALYGERVAIFEHQGDWVKVAAISQPTKKNSLGYPGWILADHVCCNPIYINEQLSLPEIVISVSQANLAKDVALTEVENKLSYMTRLPLLTENEKYLQVLLPNGETGYIHPCSTKKSSQLNFHSEKIIKEAKHFLGLKYLWGGTSSAGFDCSGFMFRLYQSQGIIIPRDASEQAGSGLLVAKESLLPGDLLFFAHSDSSKIHHVGMYIGEGLMIHAPNSKSAIKIEIYETGIYGEEFWGAKRYR